MASASNRESRKTEENGTILPYHDEPQQYYRFGDWNPEGKQMDCLNTRISAELRNRKGSDRKRRYFDQVMDMNNELGFDVTMVSRSDRPENGKKDR